jgi:hypothetical protein
MKTYTLTPVEQLPGPYSPEFADAKGIKQIFGLTRSFLYGLIDRGKIRSVSLRQKGSARGKRLFDVESVRQYLRANYDEREARSCHPRIKERDFYRES